MDFTTGQTELLVPLCIRRGDGFLPMVPTVRWADDHPSDLGRCLQLWRAARPTLEKEEIPDFWRNLVECASITTWFETEETCDLKSFDLLLKEAPVGLAASTEASGLEGYIKIVSRMRGSETIDDLGRQFAKALGFEYQ